MQQDERQGCLALVTVLSYEMHRAFVPTLSCVQDEASCIQVLHITFPLNIPALYMCILAPCNTRMAVTLQAALSCKRLDHPSIDEFYAALPGCKAWFFLGKGGVHVS